MFQKSFHLKTLRREQEYTIYSLVYKAEKFRVCSLSSYKLLISILILGITTKHTWLTPLQADDLPGFLYYSNAEPNVFISALSRSKAVFISFIDGNYGHFIPVGAFAENFLYGLMYQGYRIGFPSYFVYGLLFFFLNIALLRTISHLLSTIMSESNKRHIAGSDLYIPVSIGYLISMQCSGVWSNWDPTSSHPIYGILISLIGFKYLSFVIPVAQLERTSAYALRAVLVSIIGILTYEPFITFVLAAIPICFYLNQVSTPDRRRLKFAIVFSAPSVAIFTFGRIWSFLNLDTGYEGNKFGYTINPLVSLFNFTKSNMPTGTWTKSSVLTGNLHVTDYFIIFIGLSVVAASIFASRYFFGLRNNGNGLLEHSLNLRIGFAWSFFILILLSPTIHLLTPSWSEWFNQPGSTYMPSITVFWCWSSIIAVLIYKILILKSQLLFASTILLILFLSFFQMRFNSIVTEFEVNSPNPYGVDVLRALESVSYMTSTSRCTSLEVLSSKIGDGFIEQLNEEFNKRHYLQFCSD